MPKSSVRLLEPEVRARLRTDGMGARRRFLRSDVARWTQLVDAAGLEKLRGGRAPK
jgi:hypothetical protein